MKHFHFPSRRSKLITTAFILLPMAVVAVSTQTEDELTALFRSQDYYGRQIEQIGSLHESAIQDRARVRAQRRAYTNAKRDCQGNDAIECPKINDFETYQTFYKNAAPVEVEVDSDSFDVSKRLSSGYNSRAVQQALRRYVRIGYCPPGFANVNERAYRACLKVLKEVDHSAAPRGFTSDIRWLKNLQGRPFTTRELNSSGVRFAPTLMDRIRMMQGEGLDSSQATVRPTTPVNYEF